MKKILYFLIGFSAILFPFRYVHAAAILNDAGPMTFYVPSPPQNITIIGAGCNADEARQLLNSNAGSTGSPIGGLGDWDLTKWSGFFVNLYGSPAYDIRVAVYPASDLYSSNVEGCAPISEDTDGDGIPDRADAYPNDPTPYKFKTYAVVTDTNGNIIAITILTDRGDFIQLGADHEAVATCMSNATCSRTFPDYSSWRDSEDLQNNQVYSGPNAPTSQDDFHENTPDDIDKMVNDWLAQPPKTPTPVPGLSSGTQSTGSETDNEALRGIMTNTGNIASNQQTVADLLGSINETLVEIEKQDQLSVLEAQGEEQTYNTSGVEGDINSAALASDATEAIQQAMDTFNTETTIEDVPLDNEMIATEKWDFTEKLIEILDNNPISDAFGGVDVKASGNCSYTFDFKGRPITLTICGYESQLNAFGGILLMMSSFMSLLIIIRGN